MHNSTRAMARTPSRLPAGTGLYAPASQSRRFTVDPSLIRIGAFLDRKIFRSALVASSHARTTARYDYIPVMSEPEAILGRKL